jgi:phosphoribosylformylglycinamidine (FGAM) synthase PurS component
MSNGKIIKVRHPSGMVVTVENSDYSDKHILECIEKIINNTVIEEVKDE